MQISGQARASSLAGALVLVVLCVAASLAHAAPGVWSSEASKHYEAGLARYDAGDYHGALDELLIADRIESQPQVLYALGQAARKLGECRRAISFFRAYVEVAPSTSSAAAARAQIDRCEAELVAQAAATPQTTPATNATPTPPTKAPYASAVARVPARPVRLDLTGGLLVGAGLVVAASGTGLLAWGEHLAADGAASLAAYDEAQRAGSFRIAGGVLVGVGGVLIVGGIIRYAVLARRAHHDAH